MFFLQLNEASKILDAMTSHLCKRRTSEARTSVTSADENAPSPANSLPPLAPLPLHSKTSISSVSVTSRPPSNRACSRLSSSSTCRVYFLFTSRAAIEVSCFREGRRRNYRLSVPQCLGLRACTATAKTWHLWSSHTTHLLAFMQFVYKRVFTQFSALSRRFFSFLFFYLQVVFDVVIVNCSTFLDWVSSSSSSFAHFDRRKQNTTFNIHRHMCIHTPSYTV